MDTDLTIEEIALDVGYENQSYFFKQFKKQIWCDTKAIQDRK